MRSAAARMFWSVAAAAGSAYSPDEKVLFKIQLLLRTLLTINAEPFSWLQLSSEPVDAGPLWGLPPNQVWRARCVNMNLIGLSCSVSETVWSVLCGLLTVCSAVQSPPPSRCTEFWTGVSLAIHILK